MSRSRLAFLCGTASLGFKHDQFPALQLLRSRQTLYFSRPIQFRTFKMSNPFQNDQFKPSPGSTHPTEVIAPYADRYVNTDGPGDKRPTALNIIEDEGLIGKWSDKVILITGVSSGIGVETARAMQATGAKVFGTVRNLEKGKKVVDEIAEKAGNKGQKIELLEMDNESLESVRKAAKEFLSKSDKLNVLITNAGIDTAANPDRFEMQAVLTI